MTNKERRKSRDESVAMCGPEKAARIDLGLAILSAVRVPGVRYTHDEIAAFAGCTNGAILLIEQNAMKKLRNRLRFMNDPLLSELIESVIGRSKP